MGLIEDIRVLFPDVKDNGSYCRVRCPFHKGGQERKPSMSIILEEGYNGLHAGACHCFSCGWHGTFADIAENFGMQYIKDKDPEIGEEPAQEQPQKLMTSTYTLRKNTPWKYSSYLAGRGISAKVQELFKTYEREDMKTVFFPQFDFYGRFICATSRRTDRKFYSIPHSGDIGLYGEDLLDKAKPIAIVESQINAMTLVSAEYCRAVALLGAFKTGSLVHIKKMQGPFLLMFDGDDAGKKADIKAADFLGEYRCIHFDLPQGTDINDIWQSVNFDKDKFCTIIDSFRRPKGNGTY